jgi:hypothetical protein
MSRWPRLASLAVPVSVALGLVFAVLPRTWIESTFAVDPDGGGGLLELLLVSVPVPIAVALAGYFFRKCPPASRLKETPPLSHDPE